ncbi:MarR family winged helix-turn-helix transcriptional regulator [Tsukamurella sp. 1534]|uniref:MarR family winged helix-turn-helix transcriptional regulator n=1 Tax=Tsukamurella sp. 1534 TaxID=1151061 RepID=UPI00059339BE|nr:MarR family transcriptional regulator [Tsukamurella sp. 1534]
MSSDIAREVGPAVQAYQAAVAGFDRELARILGVGATDLACLELVLAPARVTPREVADALGFTTGSVTTMIDRLEKRGYVTRHPHPDDGRRVIVRATALLRGHVDAAMGPMLASAQVDVLGAFDDDELAAVVRFMRVATAHQAAHAERLRAEPPVS